MSDEQPNAIQEEKIEGLGGEEDSGLGDYPIDTLAIRSEARSVFEVVRRIRENKYVMNPDFQRDFIWSEDKQSKLIESVLMRIPLPVFYLAEDEQGRMIVVDGLQRLSTFQRFLDNQLRLRLPQQRELNKKRFKELSARLQNRVEDCNLALYVIDAKVPERARLDIFERVNGGEVLTRQQMRNCLYMGEATRFLREEAKTEIFLEATGRSLNTRIMRDREFVNRFCAFQLLPFESYKGEMDDFLAESLRKMNKFGRDEPEEMDKLSSEFRTCLKNNYKLFGKHAFRKHVADQKDRSVLNASLWDVMTTSLSHVSEHVVEERADALRAAFYALLADEEFDDSITYSPNSTKKVKHRFEAAKGMFEKIIHVNAT